MKPLHTETVAVEIIVTMRYETQEGRDWLVHSLKRDLSVDMGGGGNCGLYGMKSEAGSARITDSKLID